jgi:hypothetical protein
VRAAIAERERSILEALDAKEHVQEPVRGLCLHLVSLLAGGCSRPGIEAPDVDE